MSSVDQRRIGFRQPLAEVDLNEASLEIAQGFEAKNLNLAELKEETFKFASIVANCPLACLPDKVKCFESQIVQICEAWNSQADALGFEGIGSPQNQLALLKLAHMTLERVEDLACKLELLSLCDGYFDSKSMSEVKQCAGSLRNSLREFDLNKALLSEPERQQRLVPSLENQEYSWTRD